MTRNLTLSAVFLAYKICVIHVFFPCLVGVEFTEERGDMHVFSNDPEGGGGGAQRNMIPQHCTLGKRQQKYRITQPSSCLGNVSFTK